MLLRRLGARAIHGLQSLVLNLSLRKLLSVLIEVTYFDQSRPQFDGSLDLTYYIIDDAGNVLLEEIGFETIEGALEVFIEEQQRLLFRVEAAALVISR
jgi:hypothetical protein